MKHGARNDIPAEVIEIKTGGVMAQVKVKLAGTDYEMSSVMTKDSLDALGIVKGSTVHVVAKAVNVLLVTGLAIGTITNLEFGTGTLGLVQFEAALPNAGPTRFERRQGELALCQRYFQRWQQPPLRGPFGGGNVVTRMGMVLPVTMRATPSLSMSGNLPVFNGSTTTTLSSITGNDSTPQTLEIDGTITSNTGYASGQLVVIYQSGSSYLDLIAEI